MYVSPPRFHNRIAAVMEHIPFYSFHGQMRLAREAGVSKSAVSRLLSGQTAPSFAVALAVSMALEKRLGRTLDPRELLSLDGHFPTPFVCDLCGCQGCLPNKAYHPDDTLRPEFRHLPVGKWSLPACPSLAPLPAVANAAAPAHNQSGGPMT